MPDPGMTVNAQAALRICPRCEATDSQDLIEQTGYHCRRCAFELAHLEVSPSGGVRRVIGWLRAPGDVVGGRYRVRNVLGKGGYAATYLVDDMLLGGKRRALKEIPEQCYDEHESELLGRLHHDGIPDITDRLEIDGMVYLVLEFGGTQTLESERRRSGGCVPLERVGAWMVQVCDVLEYLHGQTPPIVHRDLKPANMLLDEHDRVMLIDFGIAKASLGVEGTRPLARAATHGFSPPEQILGTGTDARSDVYALGATIYALLTGTVPPPAHERLTGSQLIPPRVLRPAIPADLERLILRCLELRPEHRPQSIHQVRTAFPDGWAAKPGLLELLSDDVTVPVFPAHSANATATIDHSPRHRSETAARSRFTRSPSTWARTATTVTALLGLGTAVAVLHPWRPGQEPRASRVPGSGSAPPSTAVRSPPPEAAMAVVDAAPREPPPTSPAIVANLPSVEQPVDSGGAPTSAPRPPRDEGSSSPSRPPRAPPAQPALRPRQQALRRPSPATRPPSSVPRPHVTARRNPPAEWVLIPQPARRTD